ncbi:hypothetical protein [Novosphingobium mangrovi (ex Hu et al. 2023)]|uniref:Right handed beta helix domain-containing protein n=1 Tax=Novosphingobium mangrovi (ex Hu et al. 2023) TaxID=2930094 RepID=A0ABT0AC81_9SPHN|nr:hypothetical protein [Novosphingobium mangrovi (ex Hu et al. 2023)]MCJ1960810.1 hypothetical protein [Novosphingobium mangrovi (ex Hu et al. 2023)]
MAIFYVRRDRKITVFQGENTLEAKRQADRARDTVENAAQDVLGARDAALVQIETEGDAQITSARLWAESASPPDASAPESRSARSWAEQARTDGEAQTQLSSQAAQLSSTQALRSELAATQAAVAQTAFDTLADGLAATSSGDVFNVRGDGDVYATTYRNEDGSASTQLGAFPSKSFMDGIAPAVNSKVLALARASNVDVLNPGLDNGSAIQAALSEAMSSGKTVDLGNNEFRVGSQWLTSFALTDKLTLRGDGGRFLATEGTGSKRFAYLRAPIEMDGVQFDNFQNILQCDSEGLDLSGEDIALRNIRHHNAGGALIYSTLEDLRIRELILENISIDGPINANGAGSGQGIRYQSNGFERAYLRKIFVRNRSYQGIRIGGYPHGLARNRHIHMEALHVDGVISNGQSNGVQAFGGDVTMHDLFVRGVECYTGASSNVEPVYVVGDTVTMGNVTIEACGQEQAALAIKSSRAKQSGPIRIRTNLHTDMNAAIRIDGSDADLRGGIDIEWLWEPLAASTTAGLPGDDTYAIDFLHLDDGLTDTMEYHFVPHQINTTDTPKLDVGGFGARTMVLKETLAPIRPGQLRPQAVYSARYNVANDNFEVRAVNWEANSPLLSNTSDHAQIEGILSDGEVYWFTPMRSLAAGATLSVGTAQPRPIKADSASGLVDTPLSNGYPHAVYYSASDDALISLERSGMPYNGIGRFVPEVSGSGNTFTFVHPYPQDYADRLFVLFQTSNTGSATLNGDPLHKSDGSNLTSGFITPRVLYQLQREGSTWRASRIGDRFPAIDVWSGAGGRQIIKDVTISNGQYSSILQSYSAGLSIAEDIRTLGRTRIKNTAVDFHLSCNIPQQARARAKDITLSYFYLDNPNYTAAAANGFALFDCSDIPPAAIRGVIETSRGAVISGSTTQGAIGSLKLRNVQAHDFNSSFMSYASGFGTIDSDHATRIRNVNPGSIAAGNFMELGNTFTHLGVEPGDTIQVAHSANASILELGAYCPSRDTVRVFLRHPDASGTAVDLASGDLYITSRRLRAG